MIDHEQRRTRIGGSEIAAVLGCDERRDAYSLWALKRRLYEREPGTPQMRLGQLFEPGILQYYAEQTGCEIETRDPALPSMIHSLVYPFMVYSPDALVRGERRGVDAKLVGWQQAHRWGPAVEEIPAHIELQCRWYMAAMDYDEWDVAVVISNNEFRVYRVIRDRDFECWILDKAHDWWQRYLIGEERPPAGGSPETAYAIKKIYPRNRSKIQRATTHQVALLESYAALRADYEAAENRLQVVENALKIEVGESDGLEWPGGKFTWKATKDSQVVDSDALANFLMRDYSPGERAALMQRFTDIKPGYRRIHFRTKEEAAYGG
jgi:predicted phage-related endonuclease